MGYHETKEYSQYEIPRRRRKREGVESLFKKIKDENIPNVGRSRHVGT